VYMITLYLPCQEVVGFQKTIPIALTPPLPAYNREKLTWRESSFYLTECLYPPTHKSCILRVRVR